MITTARIAASLLLLTGATACRPDPEDLYFIVGEVVDPADDSRVPATDVLLERNKLDYCGFYATRETPFDDPEVVDGQFKTLLEARTDAEGRYLFELMRFQVAGTDGRPYCLRTSVHAENGARAELSFVAGQSDLTPPPLYRWTPELQPEDGEIPLPPLPVEPSPPLDYNDPPDYHAGYGWYAYEWTAQTASGPAWIDEAVGPLQLSPELLEDFDSEVTVQLIGQVARVAGTLFQTTDLYFMEQRSAPRAFSGDTVPVSRGAACATNLAAVEPCALTDGSLEMVSVMSDAPFDPNAPPENVSELFVTLDAPHAFRRLVLRDLFLSAAPDSSLIVSGSNDGDAWTELGRVAPPAYTNLVPAYRQLVFGGWYAQIDLDPAAGAFQRLRLSLEYEDGRPGSLYGLRELSLFD